MSQVYVPAREYHEHWPKSAALLYQAPTNTRHGASGPIQTARRTQTQPTNGHRKGPLVIVVAGAVTAAHDPPAEQQTCEGEDTVEEEFFSKVQEASKAHRPSFR